MPFLAHYTRIVSQLDDDIIRLKIDIEHIERHLETETDAAEIERLTALKAELKERRTGRIDEKLNYLSAIDRIRG